ncbi:MAG: ABC transporter permease [Acidobacteria bacterium]|nr:ABC transporter permease [Acidobacteriota bacterium]
MTAKEVLRNRFALVLLFTIPGLFFVLIWLTTGDNNVAFRLASVSEETLIEVGARDQSLVFVGVATVGLVTAFLAMSLIQKKSDVNRRLVLCGFYPSELLLGKLSVLFVVSVVIATYVAALLTLFFSPEHFLWLVAGFIASGFVHTCYGLLVGGAVKRELEGVLLIVLLVNIDAGWLQNPVFYAGAQNQKLIRMLPAYSPSQSSIIAAFTDHSVTGPILTSALYGSLLLIVALGVYFWTMRLNKNYGRI